MSIDFRNLSERQERKLHELLTLVELLESAPEWRLEDHELAWHAKQIAFKFAEFRNSK